MHIAVPIAMAVAHRPPTSQNCNDGTKTTPDSFKAATRKMRHHVLCYLASLYDQHQEIGNHNSITTSSRSIIQATQADLEEVLTKSRVDTEAGLLLMLSRGLCTLCTMSDCCVVVCMYPGRCRDHHIGRHNGQVPSPFLQGR
jgi:hypothetical protein